MNTRLRPDVALPARAPTAGLFGVLSWLRHARALHPRGVAYRAEVQRTGADPPTGSPFLDGQGRHEALIRFSKGAGLPDPLPDVLGIAVRVLDADGAGRHRDLLFASSAGPPVLRHLLVPWPRFGSRVCSAILPYEAPGGTVLLAAVAEDGPGLDALAGGASPPPVRLLAATPTGPWRPFALVLPLHPMSDEAQAALAFDPWNAGPDLRPSGLLNRLRHPAYAASRAARPGGGDR